MSRLTNQGQTPGSSQREERYLFGLLWRWGVHGIKEECGSWRIVGGLLPKTVTIEEVLIGFKVLRF